MRCPRRRFASLSIPALLVALWLAAGAPQALAEPQTNSSLVIVMDGLRPDYVTSKLMPNLYKLGRRGVVFEDHHSVFPTVTRVNAASISTGAYPGTHGLLGNSVYFPELERAGGLSTSDYRNLDRIETATGGKLLTAPTLGELLEANGLRLLVVSSGSTGSALLLNHKISGGAVIHTELVRPQSLLPRVLERLGPAPADARPNLGRNAWAVDAYLDIGLEEIHPDVTLMWLSDPDHTAHTFGIGAEQTEAALRAVDAELGRILKALKKKKLDKTTNVIVTSDHGFSTHKGGIDVTALLIRNGLKAGPRSTDVVLVQGAIYVQGRDKPTIRRIAELLLITPSVGAVFVERPRPGHPEGWVRGALSFNSAQLFHDRRPDLLVVADWTDEVNEHGYAGATANSGTAGHGSASPWDIHATLIASGPDFKRGLVDGIPSANVDIAPTLLHLRGIDPPATMDGRVLREALRGGPDPDEVKVFRRTHISKAMIGDTSVRSELTESSVDGTDYMDFAKITRTESRR